MTMAWHGCDKRLRDYDYWKRESLAFFGENFITDGMLHRSLGDQFSVGSKSVLFRREELAVDQCGRAPFQVRASHE